ncbi:MAG TPA: DNA-3-methyladenine glycosylase [Myxococcaceae bacterium]|nr:DNA-3-methyladenine glycosylase [Myxococcaceae bacterium]
MAFTEQPESPPLPPAFYDRPALEVARALLGKILLRAGGRAARIVEVEAYVGEHDLACHAAKGRTRRTEVLFGPPGRAYVYLIYGMYHCLNAVTGREGDAAAVLIRGVEPLGGIEPAVRTDGPGRLCRALDIDLRLNAVPLEGPELAILDAEEVPARRVERGPRVGVDYSGEWAQRPYRLWLRDNPFVSRVPTARRARRSA